ncbi:MAG: type II toxin-antitoxin system ParD family antitoxin [Planctomycetota bacterium]
MTTLNVSLPKDLRSFIEEQARDGGFHSVSEYMRDILRQARKRATQEKLEQLLIDGLESGEGFEATPEYWDELKNRALQNAKKRAATKKDAE